ncbi:MAG: heme o synthase, partial [Candidatus Poseidoniaceae archaeon]
VHDSLARYDLIDIERTWFDTIWTSFITLIGGTLSAGGSNAINMWYDRDIDTKMRRTQHRPLPMGHLQPSTVLLFGVFISVVGSTLFFLLHWKAAFWSFFSVGFYVFIYTMWLKRRTPQNIVIGGAAGATPPLIGWAGAAADSINSMNPLDLGSPIPWMLFALIFFWTPPHFWALALYRSGEYAKANVPMMNEVKGAKRTVTESKFYCGGLFLLGSVPCFWPESGLPLLW